MQHYWIVSEVFIFKLIYICISLKKKKTDMFLRMNIVMNNVMDGVNVLSTFEERKYR